MMKKPNPGKDFENDDIKLILPLSVRVGSKKIKLNMNQYRNMHYHTKAKAKRAFTEIFTIMNSRESLISFDLCELEYTIFFPDRRRTDLTNVGAVVDKFAQDCLVGFNYIEDDNREIVKKVTFLDGGIDRLNPRSELKIKGLKVIL